MGIIKIEIGKIKYDIVFFAYILFSLIIGVSINLFAFLLLLIPGYVILKRKERIEIDPKESMIRRCVSIFDYSINSKWKKLPEVEYVTVSKGYGTRGRNRVSHHTLGIIQQYTVKLVLNHHIRFINLSSYENKVEAIELGMQVGKSLDLRVLDYTSNNSKWIECNS